MILTALRRSATVLRASIRLNEFFVKDQDSSAISVSLPYKELGFNVVFPVSIVHAVRAEPHASHSADELETPRAQRCQSRKCDAFQQQPKNLFSDSVQITTLALTCKTQARLTVQTRALQKKCRVKYRRH